MLGSEKYQKTPIGMMPRSGTEQARREWLARYEAYTLNRLLEKIRYQAQRPNLSLADRRELESMVRGYQTLQLSMTDPGTAIDPTKDVWASLKPIVTGTQSDKSWTRKGWLLSGSRRLPPDLEAQLDRVLGGLPSTGAPAPAPAPGPAPGPTTPIAGTAGTLAGLANSIAQVLDNPLSSLTSALTQPTAITSLPTADVTTASATTSGGTFSSPTLPTAGEGPTDTLSSLFGGLGALMPALAQPGALPGMAPVVIPQPISTDTGGFAMPINPIVLILLIIAGYFVYKKWLS